MPHIFIQVAQRLFFVMPGRPSPTGSGMIRASIKLRGMHFSKCRLNDDLERQDAHPNG